MTRLILLVLFILTNTFLFGQISSIGIDVVTRYDRHAYYETNYAGRVYNEKYKLWGTSYGINVFYKKQLIQTFGFRVAAGYYRLGIDRMEGTLPFNIPGISTARNINYSDGATNLLYSTSKYHYNNVNLTLGLYKQFEIDTRTSLELEADFVGYYSIAQKYLLFDGPDIYKTRNKRSGEYGINLNIGLIRTFGQCYLEPALVIPIYQRLSGDRVFYEDPEKKIEKRFHGIGLAFTVGRFL